MGLQLADIAGSEECVHNHTALGIWAHNCYMSLTDPLVVFRTSDLTTCEEAVQTPLALAAAGKLLECRGSLPDGRSCHGYNRPS
jgi:hypothetical protein